MQPAQILRNVLRHSPAWCSHLGQADIAGYAGDVGIQGNHQLTRSHAGPHAAVDSILGPHHPSEIEVHALACAALRRTGKKESDADTFLQLTPWIKLFVAKAQENPGKAVQRRGRIRIVR